MKTYFNYLTGVHESITRAHDFCVVAVSEKAFTVMASPEPLWMIRKDFPLGSPVCWPLSREAVIQKVADEDERLNQFQFGETTLSAEAVKALFGFNPKHEEAKRFGALIANVTESDIKKVVSFLDDAFLQYPALEVLAEISVADKQHAHIIAAGVTETLVTHLTSSNPELQGYAAQVLISLFHNEKNHSLLRNEAVMRPLVQYVMRGDGLTKRYAAQLLSLLVIFDENHPVLLQLDIVRSVLTGLVELHDEPTKGDLMFILSYFLGHIIENSELREAVANAAFQVLIAPSVVENKPLALCTVYVFSLLYRPDNHEYYFNLGVVPSLVQLVKSSDANIVENALTILRGFAQTNATHETLIQQGVISTLVTLLMEANSPSLELLILEVLGELAENPDNGAHFAKEPGLLPKMVIMFSRPELEIKGEVLSLLSLLAQDDVMQEQVRATRTIKALLSMWRISENAELRYTIIEIMCLLQEHPENYPDFFEEKRVSQMFLRDFYAQTGVDLGERYAAWLLMSTVNKAQCAVLQAHELDKQLFLYLKNDDSVIQLYMARAIQVLSRHPQGRQVLSKDAYVSCMNMVHLRTQHDEVRYLLSVALATLSCHEKQHAAQSIAPSIKTFTGMMAENSAPGVTHVAYAGLASNEVP
ncbi:MAG: hypothetical protein P1U32_06785 [Legionellaceae bacterium]|nr:hypothetical protein [Legionellaceae bacterium]